MKLEGQLGHVAALGAVLVTKRVTGGEIVERAGGRRPWFAGLLRKLRVDQGELLRDRPATA